MIYGDMIIVNKQMKSHKTSRTKVWEVEDITFPFYGIFLGYRTIFNGDLDSDEYGTFFCQTSKIKVALVSPGPRRNVVYVPLEGISELYSG